MKILYSPGYGAGWVTWASGTREEKMFMLTYKPFIEALETKGKISDKLIKRFEKDFKAKFPNTTVPYDGGIKDLTIEDIPKGYQFQVNEYDGSESIEYRDGVDWFIAED